MGRYEAMTSSLKKKKEKRKKKKKDRVENEQVGGRSSD